MSADERSRPGRSAMARCASVGLLLAALVLLLAFAGDASACPTCKDGVAESDPEGVNVARGYFYSILIMLAMPFTIAGTFGAYVWREMRRQELERRSAGGPSPPLPGRSPVAAGGDGLGAVRGT